MREVISIDKNCIDKTQSEYKILKPKSNMIGKIRVTLLDDNKNVIREVSTENAIMNINNYSNYLSYLDMTTGSVYKASAGFGLSEMSSYFYLLNIDNNYKVDANKCVLKPFDFTMTGYCGKKEVYTGDDVERGSYNSSESKIYIDENKNIVYRYVYDFPAHSANGLINAIGFGFKNTRLYGAIKSEATSNLRQVDRNSRVSNQYDDGIYMYCINQTSTGFSLYRYSKFEGTLELVKTVTTRDTKKLQTYRFNSTKKYIVGVLVQDKQNAIIQKFNLLGELISEEAIKVNTVNGNHLYVKGIMDDKEEFLYIMDKTIIHVFDVKNNYSIVAEVPCQDDEDIIDDRSSYYPYSVHCDDDFLVINYRNNSAKYAVKYFNKNDFSVKYKRALIDNGYLYQNTVTYNNDTTIFSNNYGYGYTSGIVMSTLAKLPNEIIKTDKYAMRVQYEIVYTPAKIEDFI